MIKPGRNEHILQRGLLQRRF